MVPWSAVLLISAGVALAVLALALARCRREREREHARRMERFVFLELHEAELKGAEAVWFHVVDDRCFAVEYVFGEREQEQHRPPMYIWQDMVAEISLLSTRSLSTPPMPGMLLSIAGLESAWVVSVCEPASQIRLIRQTAGR